MHGKYVQLGALLIALMLLSSAAVLSHSPAYADGDDNKGKKKTKEEKEKAKEAKKKAKERVKEAREKLEEAKKKAKEIVEEAKEKVKEAKNVGRSSGDDDDDDDDEDNANIQAAPAQFKINATGIAVVKRDKTASDLAINLNTTTTKVKHNQVEMDVSGTITVGGKKYDTTGKGSIVFQGTPWGSALLKLKGKASDGSGKPLKFQMKGSLFPESANTWKMVAKNGKLGPFIHLNAVTGKVVGSGTVTPTPTPTGLNRFVISNIASLQTAGVPFSVTVTAVDATGSTIRTYAGPMKIVNATGGVDMTVSTGFVNGAWTGMVNATKAAKFRLTAQDVANPAMKGTSNEFTVVPAALARIDVTPASVTLNRGASAEFTAKGLDRFGNEIAGFAPGWSLSSPDFGSIAVTGNRANFTASTTAAAGSVVLTASSGSLSDTATINISLTATQELHHFVVSNIGTQTAGVQFKVNVTAARADGTTITTYANPIRLTDSLGTLNTTASSGFANGVWTGNVQVTKAGTDRITAQEVANPSKAGASNDFAVAAGALDRFALGPIADQTAGVEFDIVVKAVDAFGNVKTDYAGNVALGTNNGASPAGNVTIFTPATYTFTAADLGQHTFKAKMYNAKTDTTVTAGDGTKSGTSNAFRVSAASATKVTVSPTAVSLDVNESITFSAKAFDAFGNQLNTATFTWTLSPLSLGTVTPSASTSTATFIAASTAGSGTLTVTAGTGSAVANITVT